MKRILLALAALACHSMSICAQNQHTPHNATLVSKQRPAKKDLLSNDGIWTSAAAKTIQELEYGFRQSSEGDFFAANTRNGLHCLITTLGYSLEPMKVNASNESLWTTDFELENIAGNPHGSVHNCTTTIHGNTLTYSYNSYDVVYHNDGSGLRQNFVIRKKSPTCDMLCVRMRVNSELVPRLTQGRLVFSKSAADDKETLAYDDLHVWDASGKVLPAYFLLSAGTFSIVVDDAGAQYPITIDPLNHTAEWTTSASGLLSSLSSTQINSSLYGYTIAAVGDVNGDGYDDVAVGAPGVADVFSGSGSLAQVGAVFIFHGSATGLSTTPSNILQPASGIAGALFGFSIDGADVNGDGKSDVVVGAPLDQVTVGAGITAVTGSIGKVYYYTGASLTTVSNPSSPASIVLNSSDIGLLNVSNNALFGFSVAITEDVSGDGRRDLIVGAPAYAAVSLGVLGPRTGGAYVFYSNSTSFGTSYTSLTPPTFAALSIGGPSVSAIQGLLFGYSVDGTGDYNNDNHPDVVVGAPAGVDLSSLSAVLTGQVLGGSAYIFGSNGTTVGSTSIARLQQSSTGLLGNAANLFGFKVRGLKTIAGARNGSVLISAPLGGTVGNALSLNVKTGAVYVFRQKTTSFSSPVAPDQGLETPRSSALLQVLDSIGLNVLSGVSTDNMYDVNCDGFPDIVVGEPLSSSAAILALQTSPAGGNAYVFTGNSSGLFNTTPIYTASATYDPTNFSSVNAAALFGYSVTGGRQIFGASTRPRMLAGSPSGALDFGSGLLNLGTTLGGLLNFTAGNNGPGKAYEFDLNACNIPLPVGVSDFSAVKVDNTSLLRWQVAAGVNSKHFEVQRSKDGHSWNTIAELNGDAATSSYSHNDLGPAPGDNYYQIVLKGDLNASSKSEVLKLRFGAAADASLYPVPIGESFFLDVPFEGVYNLHVVDVFGRVTASFASQDKSVHLTRKEAGMQIPGVYHVEIQSAQGTIIKTVVVN